MWFEDLNDVKRPVYQWIKETPRKFFVDSLKRLISGWEKCILILRNCTDKYSIWIGSKHKCRIFRSFLICYKATEINVSMIIATECLPKDLIALKEIILFFYNESLNFLERDFISSISSPCARHWIFVNFAM